MAFSSLWQRFQRYFLEDRELGFALDISRMKFPENLFEKMRPQIENALAAMRDLEAGVIANPTENRMVGHYWLRNSALAPTPEIRSEIEETIKRIKACAEGSLVDINAYDQPGVEAGKKAASRLLQLQKRVREELSGEAKTAEEIARSIDADPEEAFHLLRHLASNDSQIKVVSGEEAVDDRFSLGRAP